MRQTLEVLVEPISIERLDRVHDARVKLAAPLLQQAAIRHFVGERVLEGVLEILIEPGLVEELGGPQAVESGPQRLIRPIGDRPEEREWHVLADDRAGLKEALVLLGEPVDARRQHHLDRRGNLDRLDRLDQAIASSVPDQGLSLHERAHRLLEEERVSAPDQELLEWPKPGVVAEERLQQLTSALGREGVQPELAVTRLARPAVLILG